MNGSSIYNTWELCWAHKQELTANLEHVQLGKWKNSIWAQAVKDCTVCGMWTPNIKKMSVLGDGWLYCRFVQDITSLFTNLTEKVRQIRTNRQHRQPKCLTNEVCVLCGPAVTFPWLLALFDPQTGWKLRRREYVSPGHRQLLTKREIENVLACKSELQITQEMILRQDKTRLLQVLL